MMTMLLKSILIFIFVVISISDWRTHKIPDRWNAGILLVAVLLALVDPSGFLAGEDTRDVCGKCPDGMPFVFCSGKLWWR